MMYAVLSLGLALLGGVIRLAQVSTAVRAAAVRGTGYHGIPPVVSGAYRIWRTAFSLCWWVLRRCHGW